MLGQTWEIFLTFSKVNLLGYGGGPSIIPLIKAEVIEKRWMTETDFLDSLALGNALPGPIATKMSAYIGYKLAGVPGGVAGLLGAALPTAILMLALAAAFFAVKDSPRVGAILKAVRPAIVGLLVWTAWDLAPSGVKSWDTLIIAVATFLVVSFLKLNPAIVIVSAAVIGFFLYGR
ncbi:MAG: chromate transporter [Armatimonadetes bacterium]|nr:chromate transporter [Armatimonadota bacterium]